MINIRLKDLAEIRVGYPFRSKIIPNSEGEISVIQMKDVTVDGRVNFSNLLKTHIKGMDFKDSNFIAKYLLEDGDILFKAKGSKNNAGLFTAEVEPTVASQQFLIIRVNRQKVAPMYISWYFNHLNDIGYFEKENEGTYIPFISKSAVSEIRIPLPSLSEQANIIKYHQLVAKEAELLNEIKWKRKMIEKKLLSQFIASS